MLGKLMKHEWKDTRKFGCLMLVLILGFTVAGLLAFQTPMWRQAATGDYAEDNPIGSIMNFMSILTLLGYAFALYAVNIAITVYLGIHFYKTMYTDQGYLTHTLPVTPGQLLLSKTIIGGLWGLIIMFAIVFSVVTLAFGAAVTMAPHDELLPGLLEMCEDIWKVMAAFWEDYGINLWFYPIYFFVSFLFAPFLTLIPMLGACSLGQLCSKARVAMSILIYFGLRMVVSFITGLLQVGSQFILLDSLFVDGKWNLVMQGSLISQLVISIIYAAVMYWFSYWVVSKKLNLE